LTFEYFRQAQLLKKKDGVVCMMYRGMNTMIPLPNPRLGIYATQSFLVGLQPIPQTLRSSSAHLVNMHQAHYYGADTSHRVLLTPVMQTRVKRSPQGMHKQHITCGSSHNPGTRMDLGKLQASSGVDVQIHTNGMQDTLLIIKRHHLVDISNVHHS
jgi:hypothetical protein